MTKFIFATCVALLCAMASVAQKTEVWNSPTIESGSHNGDGSFYVAADITKVELKDTETTVYLTIRQRSDYSTFGFLPNLYISANGKSYPVISADGIEFNKPIRTNSQTNSLDVVFHFRPLPRGTKAFDFIESGDKNPFRICGIKPVEERRNQFFPSYWRNTATGDWDIAFLEDCAIYQSKFWKYKRRDIDNKGGKGNIVLTYGNDELRIIVGKNKKGTRQLQIGAKKMLCSMITNKTIPAYPTADTRTAFTDTGYKTDTVTLMGWIKDKPRDGDTKNTVQVDYTNFFTDEAESFFAEMDSVGRFSIKVPVINSTHAFIAWPRGSINTVLEPGKTYFFLQDFKEGRQYFMGDDARLQNELLRYPETGKSLQLLPGNDPDKYITTTDNVIRTWNTHVDQLCKADPSLSARFSIYKKGDMLWDQACDFSQSRFRMPGFKLSEKARKYAYDTFWANMPDPITLYQGLSTFLVDYIDDLQPAEGSYDLNTMEHLDEFASNADELALLRRMKTFIEDINARLDTVNTPEEKKAISEKAYADNADLINRGQAIINGPNAHKVLYGKGIIQDMKSRIALLDSLKAAPIVKDINLCGLVCKALDQERSSLTPEVINTYKSLVSTPTAIALIEQSNNSYIALENRDFDKLVIKSSDNLKDLSEGEAILKKILEPFKGRYVLLDIWGTWCAPCKRALSETTQEYARLQKYNLGYLYLANRSPEEAWKNVIKEYNITGDNVAHYNLPQEQQSAIERYLKVNSFPTYKLFTPDGNLLDIHVDPRNLNDLEKLLDDLTRK